MTTQNRFALVACFLLGSSLAPLHAGISVGADLGVTKSGPSQAAAGANVTYTIEVTNGGPDAAANATMNDPLPASTTFVSSLRLTAGYALLLPRVRPGRSIASTAVSQQEATIPLRSWSTSIRGRLLAPLLPTRLPLAPTRSIRTTKTTAQARQLRFPSRAQTLE